MSTDLMGVAPRTALRLPDESEAMQFAIMRAAGLTSTQAIAYFFDFEDPSDLVVAARKWERSRRVQLADKSLIGKDWHNLSTEEMIDKALDRQYRQMATMMMSLHFAEANPQELTKLNEARKTLEAKKAGVAGKGDPFSQFMADIQSGRVKLASPTGASISGGPRI